VEWSQQTSNALGAAAVIALCLSLSPQGITASELARQVRMLSNHAEGNYDAGRAAL
jgi:homoserine acetyltransferase